MRGGDCTGTVQYPIEEMAHHFPKQAGRHTVQESRGAELPISTG